MLLHQKLIDFRVILASRSPRRQQLLRELGIDFEVKVNPNEDETYPPHLNIDSVPEFLAAKKAQPYLLNLAANEILITSDTIVLCNHEVIGKPIDRAEAIEILCKLSGQEHTVITGVCLATSNKIHSFSASTEVFFRNLNKEEIEFYVETFKPFDKAGAYGIQEWIGYVGVERINGSYFNVMGLPVQRLYVELNRFVDSLLGSE